MKIDEMVPGRSYTIRYRTGNNIGTYEGCRFEEIGSWAYPETDYWAYPELPEEPVLRFAIAVQTASTPTPELFVEDRIEEIIPED